MSGRSRATRGGDCPKLAPPSRTTASSPSVSPPPPVRPGPGFGRPCPSLGRGAFLLTRPESRSRLPKKVGRRNPGDPARAASPERHVSLARSKLERCCSVWFSLLEASKRPSRSLRLACQGKWPQHVACAWGMSPSPPPHFWSCVPWASGEGDTDAELRTTPAKAPPSTWNPSRTKENFDLCYSHPPCGIIGGSSKGTKPAFTRLCCHPPSHHDEAGRG